MILTFRPITLWPEGWPRGDSYARTSPFDTTYSKTLDLLDRELSHLRASDPTLAVDAPESACRLDGQLRADARVNYRGVILSFDTRDHGHLTYSCDEFARPSWRHGSGPSWQHNLRAIALGLESLRRVERYGIANRGQQYAGYAELGAGIALGPHRMTVEEAARTLHDGASPDSLEVPWESLIGNEELIDLAYRTAAKNHHPDRGGDAETFRRIVEARDLLAAS